MTVTYSDVAVALGRPITDPNEQAQITWWISSAELQIKARLGDLEALDPDALKFVVVEAVATKAQNPDGAQSETIDDYTYRLPVETRRVTILEEWWRLLSPDVSAEAYSVRPGFEPDDANPLAGWA